MSSTGSLGRGAQGRRSTLGYALKVTIKAFTLLPLVLASLLFIAARRAVVRLWRAVVAVVRYPCARSTVPPAHADGPGPGIVRTPDARFEGLRDWPYTPRFLTTGSGTAGAAPLRVHYVDEGPRDGQLVVLLHGEPTNAYLYRKMIPGLTAAGMRCVAPDFVGFGRSDKLADETAYTHTLHVATLVTLFVTLDLRDVTLVVQDWGGLTGLSALDALHGRVARLVIMNTAVPPLPARYLSVDMQLNFLAWRTFVELCGHYLPVGLVMRGTGVPAADVAGYTAPFHCAAAKAGAVAWPTMVPVPVPWCLRWLISGSWRMPFREMRSARQRLRNWTRPALVMFSDACPVSAGLDRWFVDSIPSEHGWHVRGIKGGHFLQEDAGPALAAHIVQFMQATPGSVRGARPHVNAGTAGARVPMTPPGGESDTTGDTNTGTRYRRAAVPAARATGGDSSAADAPRAGRGAARHRLGRGRWRTVSAAS